MRPPNSCCLRVHLIDVHVLEVTVDAGEGKQVGVGHRAAPGRVEDLAVLEVLPVQPRQLGFPQMLRDGRRVARSALAPPRERERGGGPTYSDSGTIRSGDPVADLLDRVRHDARQQRERSQRLDLERRVAELGERGADDAVDVDRERAADLRARNTV